MKIIVNDNAGAITLVATIPIETETVEAIKATNAPLSRFRYDGRSADPRSEKFTQVHFSFGETKLTLSGDEEADCYEVNNIRNICYFAPTELTIVGFAVLDGRQAMTIALAFCQHCQKAVTTLVEAEWRTCNACAAKCDHDYKPGPVHGGGVEFGYEEFCQKCGRAKPKSADEPKVSLAEQHVKMNQEYGWQIIYRNTTLTPEQIAELERAKQKNSSQT